MLRHLELIRVARRCHQNSIEKPDHYMFSVPGSSCQWKLCTAGYVLTDLAHATTAG
jgi:hypothetical protein